MADIGKNIRAIRESRGMTQDDLTEKLFVSRQTISNYEVGRSRPDVETLKRLAEILETDIQELIYGMADPGLWQKRIRRFWILAVVCISLILFGHFLTAWALEWQGLHYNILPTLLLNLLYKPVTFALLGWTVVEGLASYGKLRPIREQWARRVRTAALILAITYLFLAGGHILFNVMSAATPAWWGWLMYRIFGAAPFLEVRGYQAAAGICGALFRISRQNT